MICRQIASQLAVEANLGFKNLIANGCSFTYNNHAQVPVSWPFYLRDLGGFEHAENLAMPGAGNKHISNTTQWHLENTIYQPSQTLVIVMWSGNDRDDEIVDAACLDDYPAQHLFTPSVASSISGGSNSAARGNLRDIQVYARIKSVKSLESRAVENYLAINSLYHYLQSRRFQFLFLEFLDNNLPNRTCHFNIEPYLPTALEKKFHSMINRDIKNFYRWSIEQDLLSEDMLHPTVTAHLRWTREILLPFLKNTMSNINL